MAFNILYIEKKRNVEKRGIISTEFYIFGDESPNQEIRQLKYTEKKKNDNVRTRSLVSADYLTRFVNITNASLKCTNLQVYSTNNANCS